MKNSSTIINNSKYIINLPKDNIGCWNKVFNNDNPIHLEIGMGKGKFILENAIKNPNINYIGIEKFDSAISRAIKKIDSYDLSNLKLIRCDAKELNEIFSKEIDVIYLNFSDPWPKDRHEKRRLTDKQFLKIYDDVFKDEHIIILKTDNRKFFEYSLKSLVSYGYKIDEISLDLHKDKEDIITTEYEEKYMNIGTIYMCVYKK